MSWSIESGYSHKCPDCGTTWYDSDGGCDCRAEAEPEKEERPLTKAEQDQQQREYLIALKMGILNW